MRLYENVVSDLDRAVIAIRDGDVEKRTNQLQHALLRFAHLESAPDFANGGEPARLLEKFYSIRRARILEAQLKQSGKMLEELIDNLLSMREAWEQVERQNAAPPATSAPSPANVTLQFMGSVTTCLYGTLPWVLR